MTTSVTPLSLDVSLKSWILEEGFGRSDVAVLHFLSLTSCDTSCLDVSFWWKVNCNLSELGTHLGEEKLLMFLHFSLIKLHTSMN